MEVLGAENSGVEADIRPESTTNVTATRSAHLQPTITIDFELSVLAFSSPPLSPGRCLSQDERVSDDACCTTGVSGK